MKNRFPKVVVFITCIAAVLALRASAAAVEIRIPPLTVKAGEPVDIPIVLDEVDNLAGIKLVLNYDPTFLTYKAGSKTKATDPLMHIVNDKKPGLLIVVMAGAKGIKGKDIPIFTLKFETKKGLQQEQTTTISITEFELMGDDLKERKGSVVTHPLKILP